jgi:DNA-binding NtrC family response regulator
MSRSRDPHLDSHPDDFGRDAHRTDPMRQLSRPRSNSLRLTVFPAAGSPSAVGVLDRVRVGRSDECECRIHDSRASRVHAEFVARRKGRGPFEVRDLDSRNGTWVNGRRTEVESVRDGDVIRIGDTLFVAEIAPEGLEPREPGQSIAALHLDFEVDDAAGDDLPVLLLGPTGAGKSHIAERIAAGSSRGGAFVTVNCAELAPSLVESELFGSTRGAFTGAAADRGGLIESANGGTLFLDEIATLSIELQAKLLTVVERKLVRRVGGARPSTVDVRIIAATNVDISEAITAGVFREDLYFRLAGHEIYVPPLTRRRVDILPIFRSVLGGCDPAQLTPEAREAILLYDWPGNFRELINVGRGLVDRSRPLDYHALPARVHRTLAARAAPDSEQAPSPGRPSADALVALLEATRWNVAEVARRLEQHRTQVVRWMQHYGIQRP